MDLPLIFRRILVISCQMEKFKNNYRPIQEDVKTQITTRDVWSVSNVEANLLSP